VGLIGGLLATIVMDLFGAGLFLAMGGPVSLSFIVIGSANLAQCLRWERDGVRDNRVERTRRP
jgi:hypothetical protein